MMEFKIIYKISQYRTISVQSLQNNILKMKNNKDLYSQKICKDVLALNQQRHSAEKGKLVNLFICVTVFLMIYTLFGVFLGCIYHVGLKLNMSRVCLNTFCRHMVCTADE